MNHYSSGPEENLRNITPNEQLITDARKINPKMAEIVNDIIQTQSEDYMDAMNDYLGTPQQKKKNAILYLLQAYANEQEISWEDVNSLVKKWFPRYRREEGSNNMFCKKCGSKITINKEAKASSKEVVENAINSGKISQDELFEAIYEGDARRLLDDNPYILDVLIEEVLKGNYMNEVIEWAEENKPELFEEEK